MLIAAYNIENLFDRARAFETDNQAETKRVLDAVAELNGLFELPIYGPAETTRMLELLGLLGLLKRDEGPYARLRKLRGQLISRPRSGPPFIKAGGREDWVGWVELRTSAVNEIAMTNTARVIRDLGAHVLALVEAESRPALRMFHDELIAPLGGAPYPGTMLIDGNDARGIDVGLMTRDGYRIGRMRSHVDDRGPDGEAIFSRDCPEYEVTTPSGVRLWVLPNHFKSKFGGNDPRSRAKRRAQAERVAEIYRGLRDTGEENVVVLGDLNDTPDAPELAPLLADTDLRDASEHGNFTEIEFRIDNGHRGIGTFGLGNDGEKIDYLLLSPALFARVCRGGIFRKGAWPGSRPPRWEVYPELTREVHAASDHHAIWVEIDI